MLKKFITTLLFLLTAGFSLLQAQEADNLVHYTDDVLRYSLEYPSYDAVSLVMPAVSNASGFGGYQDNPASMALIDESFFSFDLSSRFIDETASYLGNSSGFSDNQTNIGELGFIYKVPTTRGSLVLGGGYSQTTDFNRAFSVSGRNNESTITDFYANLPRSNNLNEAAFNAFAIEDVTADSSVSIFRFGTAFSNFPGINQDVELTERGRMGEYSAFLATEVLKNFSVGGSIGYLNGSYSYRREFLESDRQNDYDGNFIDSDDDGQFDTDIDRILSTDIINADISAFNASLGFVYEPVQQLSVGASYEFPAKLHIDENYNTKIQTTFDNNTQTGVEEAPGRFSYKIVRAQRLKAGVTARSGSGLQLSATAEAVFHSNARIEFDELELNPEENAINRVARSSFDDVINFRGGLEYRINEQFTPRLGYGYFPHPQNNFNDARQFISGGFSAELTRGLIFDLGLQYSFWEDQNTLYQTPNATEVVQEEVTRMHLMAGIRMTL